MSITDEMVARALLAWYGPDVTRWGWLDDDDRVSMRAALEAALTKQPSAEPVGWIACSERMPECGVPVWLWDGSLAWIGTREHDGDGWHFTRCAWTPYLDTDGAWKADSPEWDDDYQPTHWHPMPLPPAAPAMIDQADGGGR